MSGRFVKVGGAALVAGAGYYFYQAGGDPKVAQKKAEGQLHRHQKLLSSQQTNSLRFQPMPRSSPAR